MSRIDLVKKEVRKVLVGQDKLLDSMLIALLTNSHLLVEGVPGLAKTTAINSLAKVLGLNFKRVQFTPDLLPSDITGVEIYDPKSSEFRIKKGPIFTNLLLADEINRAPAKVQSALLEVMQEKQVTIGDDTFYLEPPFFVMATQNPVEQEGTYPLPEAQLDRFMLKVVVGYNTPEEEFEIVKRVEDFDDIQLREILSRRDLYELQRKVKFVHVDDAILEYIVHIVTATREPEKYGLSDLREYIDFGASPRASINLYKASKALAFLIGKDYVTPLDIAKIAPDILRHRLILNYKAVANNIDSDYIIQRILEKVLTP